MKNQRKSYQGYCNSCTVATMRSKHGKSERVSSWWLKTLKLQCVVLRQVTSCSQLVAHTVICISKWSFFCLNFFLVEEGWGYKNFDLTSTSCTAVLTLLINVGASWAVACVTSKYLLNVLWNCKTYTLVVILEYKSMMFQPN